MGLSVTGCSRLSRDSWLGQRNNCPLAVQVFDRLVNGAIEIGHAGECLMRQVVPLQIVPDDLDVVQFGRIFRQPFDRQPVCAGGEGGRESLLTWIGPLSSTSTTGLLARPGIGP